MARIAGWGWGVGGHARMTTSACVCPRIAAGRRIMDLIAAAQCIRGGKPVLASLRGTAGAGEGRFAPLEKIIGNINFPARELPSRAALPPLPCAPCMQAPTCSSSSSNRRQSLHIALCTCPNILSEEAGPSDGCAMPSWPTPPST